MGNRMVERPQRYRLGALQKEPRARPGGEPGPGLTLSSRYLRGSRPRRPRPAHPDQDGDGHRPAGYREVTSHPIARYDDRCQQRRHGEQIEGAAEDGDGPVAPRPVREVSRTEADSIPDELAETGDDANGRATGAGHCEKRGTLLAPSQVTSARKLTAPIPQPHGRKTQHDLLPNSG